MRLGPADARRLLVQTLLARTIQRDQALDTLSLIATGAPDPARTAQEALNRIHPSWYPTSPRTPAQRPTSPQEPPPPERGDTTP